MAATIIDGYTWQMLRELRYLLMLAQLDRNTRLALTPEEAEGLWTGTIVLSEKGDIYAESNEVQPS